MNDVVLKEIDVGSWVEAANNQQREFREAVHIVLQAIGHSRNLQANMIVKGGLLLAIRYESTRYTRDLDISTTARYTADLAEPLLREFANALILAEDQLSYDTSCRLQSHKVEPKGENRTHHNLTITIGYANRNKRNEMARLNAASSARVVQIDYSFNEAVFEAEIVNLTGGGSIQTYSLQNILAEKLRSLLQQPIRRRHRRQDVYDIWLLLQTTAPLTADALKQIHHILLASCRSKGITASLRSLSDETVIHMARQGYPELAADVGGEIPPFDEAMAVVQQFYASLPW